MILTEAQAAELDKAIAILQGVANMVNVAVDAGIPDPSNVLMTLDSALDCLQGIVAQQATAPKPSKAVLRLVK